MQEDSESVARLAAEMLPCFPEDVGLNRVCLQLFYILARCFGNDFFAPVLSPYPLFLLFSCYVVTVCEEMESRSLYLRLIRIVNTFRHNHEIQALGLMALSTILVNGTLTLSPSPPPPLLFLLLQRLRSHFKRVKITIIYVSCRSREPVSGSSWSCPCRPSL